MARVLNFLLLCRLLCLLLKRLNGCAALDNAIEMYLHRMQTEQDAYTHLLQRIQAESDYSTCLIFGRHGRGMLEQKLQQQFLKPVLIYDEDSVQRNARNFNSEMLVIVYLQHFNFVSTLMQNLLANLQGMTEARILFVCSSELADADKAIAAERLFRHCQRHKLLNTICIFADFANSGRYYSYAQFPAFHLQRQDVAAAELQMFPARMRNLHGHVIRTTFHNMSLRAALFENVNNELLITDIATKFLQLLVRQLNATLEYSYHSTLPLGDLLALVHNGSVDIPNVLSPPVNAHSLTEWSYPVETARRCLVAQMQRPTVYHRIFGSSKNSTRALIMAAFCVLHSALFLANRKWLRYSRGERSRIRLLDYIFNMQVFAGYLGFSYKYKHPSLWNLTQRILCALLSLAGIMYSTIYLARMTLYRNLPPQHAAPLRLDTLQAANVKIVMTHREFQQLMNDSDSEFQRYRHDFRLVDALTDFQSAGRATIYAYPLTSATFTKSDSFRELASSSLLCVTDICPQPFINVGFPLAQGSVYAQPLMQLIMRVRDVGLLQYWTANSYPFLTISGWLHAFTVAEEKEELRVLTMHDFRYVWLFVVIALSFSTVVFICELVYFYKLRHYEVGKRLLCMFKCVYLKGRSYIQHAFE